MFRSTCTIISICCASLHADVVQWSELDGGNGHQYESVIIPAGTSWSDAVALAELLGGHLATLTSQEELDWVFDNLASDPSLWYTDSFGFLVGPYIGGYQDINAPDFSEPDGGWSWITGEEWDFTAWSPGQPNNVGGQEVAHFWSRVSTGIAPTWQDVANQNGIDAPRSFIMETVPSPSSLPALLLIPGALFRRRR